MNRLLNVLGHAGSSSDASSSVALQDSAGSACPPEALKSLQNSTRGTLMSPLSVEVSNPVDSRNSATALSAGTRSLAVDLVLLFDSSFIPSFHERSPRTLSSGSGLLCGVRIITTCVSVIVFPPPPRFPERRKRSAANRREDPVSKSATCSFRVAWIQIEKHIDIERQPFSSGKCTYREMCCKMKICKRRSRTVSVRYRDDARWMSRSRAEAIDRRPAFRTAPAGKTNARYGGRRQGERSPARRGARVLRLGTAPASVCGAGLDHVSRTSRRLAGPRSGGEPCGARRARARGGLRDGSEFSLHRGSHRAGGPPCRARPQR
jgi:hypothetical protein